MPEIRMAISTRAVKNPARAPQQHRSLNQHADRYVCHKQRRHAGGIMMRAGWGF